MKLIDKGYKRLLWSLLVGGVLAEFARSSYNIDGSANSFFWAGFIIMFVVLNVLYWLKKNYDFHKEIFKDKSSEDDILDDPE